MNKTNRMCKNVTVYRFCEGRGEKGNKSRIGVNKLATTIRGHQAGGVLWCPDNYLNCPCDLSWLYSFNASSSC